MFIKNSESGVGTARSQQLLRDEEPCQLTMNPRFLPSAVYWTLLPERIILLRCCDCSNKVAGTPDEQADCFSTFEGCTPQWIMD